MLASNTSIQDKFYESIINIENYENIKSYIENNKEELLKQKMLTDWLYEVLRLVTVKGRKDVVKLIFDEFPHLNVNHQYKFWHNKPKETLIFYAIKFPKILEYLIKEKKANINIKIINDDKTPLDQIEVNNFGTPLHLACRDDSKESIESVRLLLENGAIVNEEVDVDLNRTELYLTNDLQKIFLLLKYDADPNLKPNSSEINLRIHDAIVNHDIKATRLLARKTNLNGGILDCFLSPKTIIFNGFLSPLKLAKHYYFDAGVKIIQQEMKVQEIQNKFNQKEFAVNIFSLRFTLLGNLELNYDSAIYEKIQKLDEFIMSILQQLADYNPKRNRNRQEHLYNIFDIVENIYRECIKNPKGVNVQTKMNQLKEYCNFAKMNAENEHIANGYYTFFNSNLVKALDLVSQTTNHLEKNEDNNAVVNQFMNLIAQLKLPEKWHKFLHNEISLYEKSLNHVQNQITEDDNGFFPHLQLDEFIETTIKQEDTLKYNSDEKLAHIQLLARKIIDSYKLLKSNPEKFHDVLVDFHLTLLNLKRACDKKSTLFSSGTAGYLDRFLLDHYEPFLNNQFHVNSNNNQYIKNGHP